MRTVHQDGTYAVDYDDGDKEEHVKGHEIRLKVWYEGQVKKVHNDGTYAVQYDDGDYEDGVYLCFVVCAASNGRAPPRYPLSHF